MGIIPEAGAVREVWYFPDSGGPGTAAGTPVLLKRRAYRARKLSKKVLPAMNRRFTAYFSDKTGSGGS